MYHGDGDDDDDGDAGDNDDDLVLCSFTTPKSYIRCNQYYNSTTITQRFLQGGQPQHRSHFEGGPSFKQNRTLCTELLGRGTS